MYKDPGTNNGTTDDKSHFYLGTQDGRARVKRHRGEKRRDPQFVVKRHIHHTVDLMVWSAIIIIL